MRCPGGRAGAGPARGRGRRRPPGGARSPPPVWAHRTLQRATPPPAAAAPEPDPDAAAIQNGGLGPGSSGGCGARGPGGGQRNGCGDLSEAHGAASGVREPHRAGVAGQVGGARGGGRDVGAGWGRSGARRAGVANPSSRVGRAGAVPLAAPPQQRARPGIVRRWVRGGAPGQGEARRQEPCGRTARGRSAGGRAGAEPQTPDGREPSGHPQERDPAGPGDPCPCPSPPRGAESWIPSCCSPSPVGLARFVTLVACGVTSGDVGSQSAWWGPDPGQSPWKVCGSQRGWLRAAGPPVLRACPGPAPPSLGLWSDSCHLWAPPRRTPDVTLGLTQGHPSRRRIRHSRQQSWSSP